MQKTAKWVMGSNVDLMRQRRRRHARTMWIMTLFLVVVVWFLWGMRASISYVFSTPQRAIVEGDATKLSPVDLIPNTYVDIQGITEHRGLRQTSMRGLSLQRQEYWYFRLLGSRGVFVEVPADPDAYGMATAVHVTGRVVDLRHEPQYSPLLQAYESMFHSPNQSALRLIQVGWRPGTGRWPYLCVFGVLGLLILMNGYHLYSWWRLRRLLPGAASSL